MTITELCRSAALHDQCRCCFGQHVLSYDTSLDNLSTTISDNVEATAQFIYVEIPCDFDSDTRLS